jgi:hypothetical protein
MAVVPTPAVTSRTGCWVEGLYEGGRPPLRLCGMRHGLTVKAVANSASPGSICDKVRAHNKAPESLSPLGLRRAGGVALILQHDLQAVILLVDENVVSMRSIVELHVVCDDEAGIDLPALNALQQRTQITLDMALSGFDRE